MADDFFASRDIRCGCQAFDLSFHPSADVVAVGLVNGHLQLHGYGAGAESAGAGGGGAGGGRRGRAAAGGGGRPLADVALHTGAVRGARFTAEGDALFTVSSDRAVKRVDAAGAATWARLDAHAAAINAVAPFPGGFLVATGDDDGGVKVWDSRASAGAPVSFSSQEDTVTCLAVDMDRAVLLASSCDGTLAAYDLRKVALGGQTDALDDELLSLAVVKGGTAVVCGTQDGVLVRWGWGDWAPDAGPDRFPGHPDSVDALVAVDDDTVVTGSSDGILRLVTVAPNKVVGVLGEHADFPIERLAWARDGTTLGSVSHDDRIKLWDVAYLFEDDDEDGAAAAAGAGAAARAGAPAAAAAAAGGARAPGARKPTPSRFVGLPALAMPARLPGDDDDDDDDDDDEEDEEDEDEDDEDDDRDGDAGMGTGGGGGRGRGRAAGGSNAAAGGGAAAGRGAGRAAKGKKGGAGRGFYADLEDD
jgi:hypothetical protein